MSREHKTDAQDALFAEISRLTKAISEDSHADDYMKVEQISRLALAYRYVAGGAQPGSTGE